MKENMHYLPLHVVDEAKRSKVNADDLCWVVMRSLQNKVIVTDIAEDGKQTTERRYGYENAEHLFCEFFMPMKETVVTTYGKRVVHHVPAISGLFFVKDRLSEIRKLASGKLGFELKFIKGREYQEPVIVKDSEMNVFIEALKTASEVRFFAPDESGLRGKIGKKVRIYQDNTYFEGHIISIRGSKRRWLRLAIDGFLVAEMDIDLAALQTSGQIVEVID